MKPKAIFSSASAYGRALKQKKELLAHKTELLVELEKTDKAIEAIEELIKKLES